MSTYPARWGDRRINRAGRDTAGWPRRYTVRGTGRHTIGPVRISLIPGIVGTTAL
jgi:hypothetical protein